MFYLTAKMELIELVKAYKSRTYDEEIRGVENQGGKLQRYFFFSTDPVFLVRRCRRHQ
jgi:hypothetical protein